MLVRAMKLFRSRNWPIVKATVLSAECPHASYGCTVATINYEYTINGEKYGAACEKPFILRDSVADYAAQFVKGMDLKVRVKPGNPTVSVPTE
jgi:hypothetical protein